MFRIAVLSDIHGNIPALEAVLGDIRHAAPDQVIVAGDLVGRGPQSREALEVIAGTGWPVVMGNHEEFQVQCARGNVPDDWQDGWWDPTRAVGESLGAQWIDWMAALPFQYVLEAPGALPILVVHGSPRKTYEGLNPHDSDEKILDILTGIPYPVVISGHTHRAMNRRVNGYHVINAGSVGVPFDHPGAQYALLDWNGQAWDVDLRRIPYDRKQTLRLWHETGFWDSGIAARVFAYELETTQFHFYHYVRYCEEHGLQLNAEASFVAYRQHANGHF